MSIRNTEIESDLERLSTSFAAGKPADSELKLRIRRESDRIREERLQQRGVA